MPELLYPPQALEPRIDAATMKNAFGSLDSFFDKFNDAASGVFGSG